MNKELPMEQQPNSDKMLIDIPSAQMPQSPLLVAVNLGSPIKYRDHRGSLSDSMSTTQVVRSVEEIKAHLNKYYNDFNRSVEEIKFEHVGVDTRNGWDTFYVLQRLNGETQFTVAGMSDGRF